MGDYPTPSIVVHPQVCSMPSSKLSTLWLCACLTNGRRGLLDGDVMGIYDLPASPLSAGTHDGQPYRPAGLVDSEVANLGAFLERAAAIASIEDMVKFVEGKGMTENTADTLGRNIFRVWFAKARMHNKVNDIWDGVLQAKNCRPQDLIADNAEAIKNETTAAVYGGALPSPRGIRTTCDEALIEALFGEAGMSTRAVDSNVTYCLGGFWHHQWERYRKFRKSARDKYEKAKEQYEEKRDSECFETLTLKMADDAIVYLLEIRQDDGAPPPSKQVIRSLLSATSKFLLLSAWVADEALEEGGPAEAEAFLEGVLAKVGVKTKEEAQDPGPRRAAAGE